MTGRAFFAFGGIVCDSTYEYEPQGIFGQGSGSGLSHVGGEPKAQLGFLAARDRPRKDRVEAAIGITRFVTSDGVNLTETR